MKNNKFYLFLFGILFLFLNSSNAQNVWASKADFGGTERYHAAGFSVGTKAYLGTGSLSDGSTNTKDFWAWNQSTNSWSQVASLPGSVRWGASGFTINGVGYIAFGINSPSILSDLWAYDTLANSWTPKTGLTSNPRYGAFCFVIGDSVVYFGGGSANTGSYLSDVWEYSPATDSWKARTSLPDDGRVLGTGFSLNNMGYAGSGYSSGGVFLNDFWQFDPGQNSWNIRAKIPGHGRSSATAFSMQGAGYFGFGGDSSNTTLSDLYQYDDIGNTWSTVTQSFPDSGRSSVVSLVINNTAYIGTGSTVFQPTGSPRAYVSKDFWQFGPLSTGVKNVTYGELTNSYPNPADNLLNISLPAASTVTVCNILNQQLYCSIKPKGISSVDVSKFSNGTYLLYVSFGENVLVGKFVVQH